MIRQERWLRPDGTPVEFASGRLSERDAWHAQAPDLRTIFYACDTFDLYEFTNGQWLIMPRTKH